MRISFIELRDGMEIETVMCISKMIYDDNEHKVVITDINGMAYISCAEILIEDFREMKSLLMVNGYLQTINAFVIK